MPPWEGLSRQLMRVGWQCRAGKGTQMERSPRVLLGTPTFPWFP